MRPGDHQAVLAPPDDPLKEGKGATVGGDRAAAGQVKVDICSFFVFNFFSHKNNNKQLRATLTQHRRQKKDGQQAEVKVPDVCLAVKVMDKVVPYKGRRVNDHHCQSKEVQKDNTKEKVNLTYKFFVNLVGKQVVDTGKGHSSVLDQLF